MLVHVCISTYSFLNTQWKHVTFLSVLEVTLEKLPQECKL